MILEESHAKRSMELVTDGDACARPRLAGREMRFRPDRRRGIHSSLAEFDGLAHHIWRSGRQLSRYMTILRTMCVCVCVCVCGTEHPAVKRRVAGSSRIRGASYVSRDRHDMLWAT